MAILSIGAIAMDISINVSEIPRNDSFSFIHSSKFIPGGSASNFSCNIRNFTSEVFQFGGVGNDHYGYLMKEDLDNNNVNTSYLNVIEDESTLYNYVFTSNNGEHSIVANLGTALEKVRYKDISLDDFNLMYTDMFSSKASLYLAEKIIGNSGNVFFNVQCSPSFMKTCGIELDDINKMLKISSLIVMNRDVTKELGACNDIEEGLKSIYTKYKPKDGIICTLGSEGAIWYKENEIIKSKPFLIDVVNSVGAGDAFNAALCYKYYVKDESEEESLLFANAAAAFKCTKNSPRLNSSIDEIKNFINGGIYNE